jgi:broad specificity phosphatase PhoE
MIASNSILMIRHAQSAAQFGEASSDVALIPLSERGENDAAAHISQLLKPDLIVVSPFIRTRQTAQPLIDLYPEVPVEEWSVQEFTYLAPERCRDMTAEQRAPMVRDYWERRDPDYVDGEGAESFNQFCQRVVALIRRCQELDKRTYIFSHTMFMQAVRMCVGQQEKRFEMEPFRETCFLTPIRNLECIEFHAGQEDCWPTRPQPNETLQELCGGRRVPYSVARSCSSVISAAE